MKTLLWLISIFIVLILGYNIWANAGREYDAIPSSRAGIGDIYNLGSPSGKGNLLGFQPYFRPWDYCNAQHFQDALSPYFEKAKAAGLLQPNTIVVLPEYTGTWLAFANEKAPVYQADSLYRAVSLTVNASIFRFIQQLLTANTEDKIRYALFSLKAAVMSEIYQQVFSYLAGKYRVTVVAGSIVLPDPSVDASGRLHIKKGPLYNASFVFGPDGKIVSPPIKKIFPNSDEMKFITPAADKDIPLVQTAAGNLAVLLSAGSRHDEAYAYAGERTAILVIPAIEDSAWIAPWKRNTLTPAGALSTRSSPLTGIAKLAGRAGIHNAISVNFTGRLWEMHAEGSAVILRQDSLIIYKPALQKGKIINLWL